MNVLEGTISKQARNLIHFYLDALVYPYKLVFEGTHDLSIQFVHFQLHSDGQQKKIESTIGD